MEPPHTAVRSINGMQLENGNTAIAKVGEHAPLLALSQEWKRTCARIGELFSRALPRREKFWENSY
jgi:hypothetical protein